MHGNPTEGDFHVEAGLLYWTGWYSVTGVRNRWDGEDFGEITVRKML